MRNERLHELHILFHQMRNLRERFFYQANEGLGLPIGQSQVVRCLSHHPNISQHELADMLHIRPGSLSELLGKLEKGCYLTRVKQTEDRRIICIQLTEKGRDISKKHHAMHMAFIEKMFMVLPDKDVDTLYLLLNKLVSSWQEDFDEPPQKPCRANAAKQAFVKKNKNTD
jgi:DNA-binding MarR family transcriptional regulator